MREAVALTRDDLAAFAGDYAIEGNNTLYRVRDNGDELLLETDFKSAIRFVPLSKDQFFSTSHDREVRFVRKGGKIVAAEVMIGNHVLFRLNRK